MITLCQITMDAGDGIAGSTIKWNLKQHAHLFERIIVVDGNLTEAAQNFYSQFKNLEVIDSPWRDSYVDQYRAFARELKDQEWALYLDCDEIPSPEFLADLKANGAARYRSLLSTPVNLYKLPCVLHLTEDGKRYYPSEPQPDQKYTSQWTKSILFRKEGTLCFGHFGSHVVPGHGPQEVSQYLPLPYYHMKSLESFVENDVWQAFLHPRGQQYSEVEAAQFKKALAVSKLQTTKEFKKLTKDGKWNPLLVKFAWDHRHEVGRPISRLAWVYWILNKHPMPSPDPLMTWEHVKKFVLSEDSFKIYEKNCINNNCIVID